MHFNPTTWRLIEVTIWVVCLPIIACALICVTILLGKLTEIVVICWIQEWRARRIREYYARRPDDDD